MLTLSEPFKPPSGSPSASVNGHDPEGTWVVVTDWQEGGLFPLTSQKSIRSYMKIYVHRLAADLATGRRAEKVSSPQMSP